MQPSGRCGVSGCVLPGDYGTLFSTFWTQGEQLYSTVNVHCDVLPQHRPCQPRKTHRSLQSWRTNVLSLGGGDTNICYWNRKLNNTPNIPIWLPPVGTNGADFLDWPSRFALFNISLYSSGHKHIQEHFTGLFLLASSFLSSFPRFMLLAEQAAPSASCHHPVPKKRWPNGVETDSNGYEGQLQSWAWQPPWPEPHKPLWLQCFRDVSS